MKRLVSDIAFTPAVKAAQQRLGSRKAYANFEQRGGWSQLITPELEAFIAARDSAYLGTASADGQPYIQHRGGPKGFVKVLDERTLGFADYSGNSQYISVGNLSENSKAYLFFMDYAQKRRIKVWGRAELIEDDPALVEQVRDANYPAAVERVLVFHVLAWDRNCELHITPRFTEEEAAERRTANETLGECVESQLPSR